MKHMKLSLLILTILSINSCGAEFALDYRYPKEFYADMSVPIFAVEALDEACNIWNTAAKIKICIFKGITKENIENKVSWRDSYFESILGVARADWSDGCKIEVVSFYFGKCEKDIYNNITCTDLGRRNLLNVILHEMGHCYMHNYHSKNEKDLMYSKINGTIFPTIFDINQLYKSLNLPGGASGL